MMDQYAGFGRLYDQMAAAPALIDSSPAMLREARKKSRAVRWYRQDVTRLRLTERAEAVTCHFDAVNHVLDTSSLQRAFVNVAGILRAGGLFLFDLNTRTMMRWLQVARRCSAFGLCHAAVPCALVCGPPIVPRVGKKSARTSAQR